MTNQLATYDFTLPADKNGKQEVIVTLNQWAKKWVFQREIADSGFDHWQGRLSLIKKRRIGELIKLTADHFDGVHWSPTTTDVHSKGNFNYVMKADSRTDGPFTDQDNIEPPPLTRQLKSFLNQDKYPWQEQLLKMVAEEDDRSIKLIIDHAGNSGKSIFAEYLEYEGKAWEVPPFRAMEDIMQCVMSINNQKAYIIDMPRAMKKDKLSEFYSGLEALKNGVAYDKRYSFKKKRMDRPQVIVFTNKEPCWEYMSKDRWEIFYMEETSKKLTSGAAL